jgi:integrase
LEDEKRCLTARAVMNAKPKRGKRKLMLNCGRRLFLQVIRWPDGRLTRSWVFQFQRGKTHQMGLGKFPEDRSLAEARKRARELSLLLLDGTDPLQARNEQRARDHAERSKVVKTFQQVTDDFLALHERGWRSNKHREQVEQSLKTYVMPHFGKLEPSQINQHMIFQMIEPLWAGDNAVPVTAGRILDRLGQILAYSASKGFGGDPNAPKLTRAALPKRKHKVEHFAALPFDQVPALIADLRKGRDDFLADACPALEFLILTCCRSGELIGGTWQEIDFASEPPFAGAVWQIPAERMKVEHPHVIPLTGRMLELLGKRRDGSEPLFPVAEHHMRRLLADMREGATIHGMRATFRGWAAARTNFADHICEMALAHRVGGVQAMYQRRAEPFDKRRQLMEQWTAFCCEPKRPASVVPIRSRKKS